MFVSFEFTSYFSMWQNIGRNSLLFCTTYVCHKKRLISPNVFCLYLTLSQHQGISSQT